MNVPRSDARRTVAGDGEHLVPAAQPVAPLVVAEDDHVLELVDVAA